MDVSVVIPAYNASKHLTATLQSVFDQREPPSEIIVVDDGSTDDTAAVAAALGSRVVAQRNGGPSAARNAGVGVASSTWIAFLDADDRWLPAYLETIASALSHCPDVAAIFTDYRLDDPASPQPSWFAVDHIYRAMHGNEISPGVRRFNTHDLSRALLRSRSFVGTSALVVRRTAFVQCGGFDESFRWAEDLEFMLRLFARAPAAAIEEPLSVYRKHAGSLTADEAACAASERRVWQAVIAAPDRYTHGLASELQRALPEQIRRQGLAALRTGRFTDARVSFGEAARLGDRVAAFALPLVHGADTPPGRAAYRRLRSSIRALRAQFAAVCWSQRRAP